MYAYVGGNPVNLIDKWGLWGEDAHSGIENTNGYETYTWAQRAGFTGSGAAIIARANDWMDGGWNSWMPIFGDQSRHFNQFSRAGYNDSREYWAAVEFTSALREWENGNEDLALAHIGRGLHSIQDIYAHRDWDTGITGRNRHPDWYDDWDDSRNECAAQRTEQATMFYLREFIRLTYGGYTH